MKLAQAQDKTDGWAETMTNDLPLRYSIPGDNNVALTDALARDIRRHFAADRENRFQLFLLAAGIRKRYMRRKGSQKDEYEEEFRNWYASKEMDKLFGQLPNLAKYGAAGEVIAHTATLKDSEKYLKRLPTSMRALYSTHLLLQRDKKLFEVCLTIHPTRKSVDEPQSEWGMKGDTPLIHPDATSQEIDVFVERWFATHQPSQSPVNKEKMVLLAKFYVSKDLFAFDKKTGQHLCKVDIKEVEELLGELQSRLPKGKVFAVEDDITKIRDKYYKAKRRSGSAAKILAKPSQRIVKSKKKASSKKTAKKS
jgi:hypothetical protein